MKGIKWKDSNEPDLQVEGMVLFKKRQEKSKGMYLVLLSRRQRSAAKNKIWNPSRLPLLYLCIHVIVEKHSRLD
jgi:hypothetical protein